MTESIRIGDVCKTYGITSRTLRYYEEVGLLTSQRHDNGYRSYDDEAIARLEQILFLRELKLSIREITDVLDTQDANRVSMILSAKLDSISHDIASLQSLKRALQVCLDILEQKGMHTMPARQLEQRIKALVHCDGLSNTDTEVEAMSKSTLEKLTQHEVRIVRLPPMMVASCRAESTDPESKAWDTLIAWKEKHNINEGRERRQFGFNNPSPQGDNPVYGYEVWEEVDKDIVGEGDIIIKPFAGGVYAVATVTALDPYMDIPKRWRQLHQWVMDSDHEGDSRQCLEEHLPAVDGYQKGFQLDLHYPIKQK